MSREHEFGYCRSKVGFLFLRDCRNEAVGECEDCGRPVCIEHRRPMGGRLVCMECQVTGWRNGQTRDETLADDEVYRSELYAGAHYHPPYSGRHRYYSDVDFRTFDADAEIVDHGSDDKHDDRDLNDPLES